MSTACNCLLLPAVYSVCGAVEKNTLTSVFVRSKKRPKWKTNTDMQTDHITEFVSLSSHFSSLWSACVFLTKKKNNSCMTSSLELITQPESILTVLTPSLPLEFLYTNPLLAV